MIPDLFDRMLLRRRRRRALALGPATFLIERVADELADRLAAVLRHFEIAADIGTPTAAVRQILAGNTAVGTLIALDSGDGADARCAAETALRVVADEEVLPFADESLDLVVSGLALQAVNDLPGALVQIRRALKPDGLFLAA